MLPQIKFLGFGFFILSESTKPTLSKAPHDLHDASISANDSEMFAGNGEAFRNKLRDTGALHHGQNGFAFIFEPAETWRWDTATDEWSALN